MSFPKEFVWGTATSAYQVEGAWDKEGRGLSIWDTFCSIPGNVKYSHSGKEACDQFHRYKEDVKLLKECGIQSYRFSISWPRIIPHKNREINREGFNYYHRLIDELLSRGIEPCVTLYHWDLPQYLEDEGGWCNRETSYAFKEFASACFQELGGKIQNWVTLNEPWCVSQLGYYTGEHAPGRKNRVLSYNVFHHLNLAHGLAVREYRRQKQSGKIGIILNPITPRPATQSEENQKAAEKAALLETRVLMDPLYGKGYPEEIGEILGGYRFPVKEGDMEIIASETDFLGISYYNERAVVQDPSSPEKIAYVRSYHQKTRHGWPVVPEGLYRILNFVKENYDNPHVYVTGNGCACEDRLSEDDSACSDPERIDYLRAHFKVLKRALDEGVNLKGYYLWSFIDSFEWAFGYTRRFGIVHCNFNDYRRTPKDSYFYFREVIAGHEHI